MEKTGKVIALLLFVSIISFLTYLKISPSNKVHALICDNKVYYVKYKHIGESEFVHLGSVYKLKNCHVWKETP